MWRAGEEDQFSKWVLLVLPISSLVWLDKCSVWEVGISASHICPFEVWSARGKRGGAGGQTVGHVPTYACVLSHLVVSDSLRPYGLYSPPDSSVRGILQARTLEWVAVSFWRGVSTSIEINLQRSIFDN